MNTTGKRRYVTFILFFIIISGTVFCHVDLFTDAGWKSKWYWLYTAVSVCGLSFFLTGAGRPETGKTFRIGLPDCLLAALVLYCLSRAAAGQFAEAFLMRCTAFLPIYCLAGRVVRNRRPAADGAVDRKPDPGLSEKPERRIAHARDGTVGRGGALLFFIPALVSVHRVDRRTRGRRPDGPVAPKLRTVPRAAGFRNPRRAVVRRAAGICSERNVLRKPIAPR